MAAQKTGGDSKDRNQSTSATEGRWHELALAKAEIIRPLEGLNPIPPDLMADACQKAAQLLGKPHVPKQTIYNWLKKKASNGITALEHQRHRDRGESTLHPDLRQFIEDALKSSRNYSRAAVHRLACDKARTMELDEAAWPSLAQVRFLDAQLSEAAKKYGRQGRRAYRNTHEVVGHFEAETINHIWQCDHHKLDILVINPETNEVKRPWITAIIDDYSRAILGFYLSFEDPNSNSIALALHHALLPKTIERWVMHGIPIIFYVDNGKDYRSRHIREACLHFSIEVRSHEPYLPRLKGKIERWFRSLEEMCIAYLDGYVGSNPQKRPERVIPNLTLEQLRTKIIDFIINTYHERFHSQTKETPRVRWQRAITSLRTVDHADDLDYLLENTTRTVQNDGIRFHNCYYTDVEGKLAAHIGRTVHIFYNRNDESSIRVRYRDQTGEHVLCVAYSNVTARERATQNKVARQALSEDIRASHARSKAEEKRRDQHAVNEMPLSQRPSASQSTQTSAPHARRRFTPRYRFEIEELDDDDDS